MADVIICANFRVEKLRDSDIQVFIFWHLTLKRLVTLTTVRVMCLCLLHIFASCCVGER